MLYNYHLLTSSKTFSLSPKENPVSIKQSFPISPFPQTLEMGLNPAPFFYGVQENSFDGG